MSTTKQHLMMSNCYYFEDPSLSSHLKTIYEETKNLPKLKYSLACIANCLAYNNSNRHYNITAISKPNNFKQIIKIIVHFQDQKILEQTLSILNVLLNQGNDLTVQQQGEIMHSLSYVSVNNQIDKGLISDKLVQEILYLSYKLKTKLQLSQFVSSLMAEKMSASQAKKLIQQLKKQQLKNIQISDLIKVGMKFKTNVLLMNQILNLIYEKVFVGREESEIKKLFEFLPKIVEENIDEETISYKCLQIYKIIQKKNPILKFDPLIGQYLGSLMKYKKSIFLPLKREFVSTREEFLKILQFGKQFQIYHLLVVDYLVRNGYNGGKQSWRQVLQENTGNKNRRLKEICLRIAATDGNDLSNKRKQTIITESDQLQFLQMLPIETVKTPNATLQKLLAQPSISNCLHVIKHLHNFTHSEQLLLTIHRIALKAKQFNLVKQIEKIVKQTYSEQFVYEKLKNITKVKHKIVLKGQLYFIWLPVLARNQSKLRQLEKELVEIMGYDSVDIEDKFYVVELMVQNRMDQVVKGFLLYLNRQLQAVDPLQQHSRNYAEIIFKQLKYYLKQWGVRLRQNTSVTEYYFNQLSFHLQRTAELLFSKLVDFRTQKLTVVLFQLEKWNYYGDNWRSPYRWLMNALEEINEHNSIFTLDCLELFQIAVQNISDNKDLPPTVKDRFMKIVEKNWPLFDSEQLFAIERIVQLLWPNHQYPILSALQPIKPISQLIIQQQQFNKKNEYFFQSQHPTSLFLQNLQKSHYFGQISQQQFVKNILLLYDKRFNETKKFTQKNVISLMNYVIWLYQYSEEDMQKGLCEMTMGFLSYKSQKMVNDVSSYNIRKKCVEIIAVVSHSINLLKVPIKQLLQVYIGEHSVMRNLNEIIQTIIESKPEYISQLGLQPIVQSIMIGLITCEDMQLIEEYIDFIEAVCYIQQSPYALMFEQSLQLLYQVIKVEFKIVEKYRKSLVLFVIDILRHYDFMMEDRILWFLMNKYFVEADVQQAVLDCLISNKVKDQKKVQRKTLLKYQDEKLLIRLIMHHNESENIIKLAKQILTTFQKSQRITNDKLQQTKTSPSLQKQPAEDKFLAQFSKGNYPQCQRLLQQIRNPFFTIQKSSLQAFLNSQKLSQNETLLNFLTKNPTTRNDLLSIKQFYLHRECMGEIERLVETIKWSEENLNTQKLKIKSFNQEKLTIQLQETIIEQLIKPTVTALLKTENIKAKMIKLLNELESVQERLLVIEFYSKCSSADQKAQKLLSEVVSELKINQGLEMMRIAIPYKLSNVCEATTDYLLYHLFVHLVNTPFMLTPELENQQRYIKDVVHLISQHELQKHIHTAHHFFVNMAHRVTRPTTSNKISKLLVGLTNSYLMLFEGQGGSSGFKGSQPDEIQLTALLCALLCLYNNGQNVMVGVSGKIMAEINENLAENTVLREIYLFLMTSKPIPRSTSQYESTKSPATQQSPTKKTSSALTSSIQNAPQKQKKQSVNVVFAKQSPNSEQQQVVENNSQNKKQSEVSEAFQKGKQLQEYMSVAPRQIKALAEKHQQQKQEMSPKKQLKSFEVSVEKSIQLADQQKLIRPKEPTFDESTFYQPTTKPMGPSQLAKSATVTQKQRQQLLSQIRSKQNDEISIATLKQHAKFISSLIEYDTLSKQELQQLMKSIDHITSTVNQHHYYVKKLVQLEVTFKLIRLYKRKDVIIPKHLQGTFADMFQSKLLTLHHAMSCKKQRKTIIFDDEFTIEFFKLIVKKSLVYKKSRNQNIVILQIVNYCIKSIDAFFKQGLISMLIQLIKMDINQEEVLKFFCKIQLTKHIIFEIYQRGMLDKFVEVFMNEKKKGNDESTNTAVIYNKWIRLAGKICTTVAIQQKYLQKRIHQLVWQKHNTVLKNDLQSLKSIAFFFASLGRKNIKVFEFMVENSVLEKLMASLQNQNSEQLYMMFYNLGVDNLNGIEYYFRIKYHLHLIEQMTPKPEPKTKSKYFYKYFFVYIKRSLGQVMTNKPHQSLFFKEQIISKLVQEYENKSQPSIYQCLLDFIVTLENDKQFEELKKQGFWNCLGLFEYKLSSEATYAYILQIFLVMIKKGRIKQFNTPQIRGKVTLKAQYSINLQGKQLALRFITALSIQTKQCYITERCIRLYSSLVGFKVTKNELDLIEDILDVEGMLENYQFLQFCHEYEITQNIAVRFKTFGEREILSALKILNILGTHHKNNKILRQQLFLPAMEMIKSQLSKPTSSVVVQDWLLKLILVIVSYQQSKQHAQRLELGRFLLQIIENILAKQPKSRKKLLSEYVEIVDTCKKNNILPLDQLQKILEKLNLSNVEIGEGRITEMKQQLKGEMQTQSNQMMKTMTEGITVKMYKGDGSFSQLLLFLTEDRLELNCIVQKGEPVKQKWRLVLSEINEILSYQDEKQYENSAFYKSGGIFSRPPDRKLCLTARSKTNEFNMLFMRQQDKIRWRKYIEYAIENSKKLLKQFK